MQQIRLKPLVALFIGLAAPVSMDATAQQPRAPLRWENAIAAFEAQDQQAFPESGGVLFVGSSSILMWKTLARDMALLPVIQRGFGGSQLSDVLFYMDRIVLPYRPADIVLYEGDNDLGRGKSPTRLLRDFQMFVDRVHAALPEARVHFLSVKPSIRRRALMTRMHEANTLIRGYCAADERLHYINVYDAMLTGAGEPKPDIFVDDDLHLNAQGYAIWTDIVKSHLVAVRAGFPSAAEWEPAIRRYETQDALHPPRPGGIVFVGSSSIARWRSLEEDFAPLPVIRRGYGGSIIADAVYFAERIVVPYRPRAVVLYAGGNDINRGLSPERVAADFRQFVVRVHSALPETHIFCPALKPTLARRHLRDRMETAVRLIRQVCDEYPYAHFVDTRTPMLGPDGEVRAELLADDGLHLSPAGYALWTALLQPLLQQALDD